MAEGKKILIVDDEPDVVMYLTMVLQNGGYVPYSASDVDRGYELIAQNEPDLICLDIMMPKQLGISLYLKLKQDDRYKHIPVVIISGVAQEQEFDFRSYVPDKSIPPPQYYLEKPIAIARFLEVVKKFTGSGESSEKREKTNA